MFRSAMSMAALGAALLMVPVAIQDAGATSAAGRSGVRTGGISAPRAVFASARHAVKHRAVVVARPIAVTPRLIVVARHVTITPRPIVRTQPPVAAFVASSHVASDSGYGDSCESLLQKARATGSAALWRRYHACIGD